MSRSIRPFFLALAAAFALVVPQQTAAQSQTGSLVLEVVDAAGDAVPKVAITLESDDLQGLQARETDRHGRAHFAFLPPGSYEAEFEAEGYVTVRASFGVALGSAGVETVPLTAGESVETQVVSVQAPLDVTETGIRFRFDEETLQALQIGSTNRDYLSVLGRASGVATGGGNPNVHGATIGENRYLVDGVDTTDPVTGTFGHGLTFDSIQAIEFQTGGFRAESGLATGGIVNVITKSGGNELDASVDLRYNDNGLVDSSELEIGGAPAFDNSSPTRLRRFDLTLGGPMRTDKLWYQLAYSDEISNRHPAGGDSPRAFSSQTRLLKLTWQPAPRHRVSFQYSADATEIDNVNSGLGVHSDAHAREEQGGDFYAVTYWGQFPNNWNLKMRASKSESALDSLPRVDSDLPSRINLINGYLSQNYIDARFSTRARDQFGWDLEHRTSGRRWHAVKIGAEVQRSELTFRRHQPGGATEYVLSFDEPWGTNAQVVRRDRLIPAGTLKNPGTMTSFYVQDTWHASDRLTVDYGLRRDRTAMDDDVGEEVVSFSKLQPRLGIAWDVLGDKRHAISGSAGRYMDPLILTVASAANQSVDATVLDLNEAVFGIDCNGDGMLEDRVVSDCFSFAGGSGSVTDPDLAPTYKDEISLGYKFAIRSNLKLGARWYWSETEDIIEDREIPDAPGLYEILNLPGLIRRYEGLELDLAWEGRRVHLSGNWTIAASKGNIEYTQHVGSDFDIDPDHSVNRYGYLSDDQRHRVKVYGWADLPRQFRLRWEAAYGSGGTYTVTDSTSTIYGAVFVEPRGSRRLPSTTNIDLEVRKAWDVGERGEVELIASVFNLLKANGVTGINGEVGALGQITSYQSPRRYEFGFRFRWQ